MALVTLEDIVKKRVPDITDSDAAKLCKIIGECKRLDSAISRDFDTCKRLKFHTTFFNVLH